jgi:hypothetical protein
MRILIKKTESYCWPRHDEVVQETAVALSPGKPGHRIARRGEAAERALARLLCA